MKNKKALVPSLACVARLAAPSVALAAATALAQPAPGDDPPANTLPVVRVQAQSASDEKSSSAATRLELTLRETPQSITVVGAQQIRDFGLTDINTLLDHVPGVLVERVETDRTYFSARGFDVTNFQVDGLGLPFANGAQWGALDTAAFERVEVLRGATGLLAGTGNPSATVNFVRKRAAARTLAASGGLTLGSWNQRRVEADVASALTADGSLRARAVLADEDKDSWLDRYGQHRSLAYGVLEADLARGSLLTLGVNAQRSQARSPMWGALPLVDSTGRRIDYPRNTSSAADWAWWTNRDTEVFAELTQDLGQGWQARATLTRRSRSTPSELFYVYGAPKPGSTPGSTPDSGLFAYPSAFDGHYVDTVADVFVSGPFTLLGRRHQLMAGLDAGRQTLDELSRYAANIGAPVPPLAGWDGRFPKPAFGATTDGSDVTRRRDSAYAAAQLDAGDALKLVLGLNATRVRNAGRSYGVDQAARHGAIKPYLGAVLDLSATYSAYASYASVFNPQLEADRDHRTLDPLEGSNLEAGLKAAWDGLDASAAVFRTRQRNVPSAAGQRPDFSTYYEGIIATSTGYELEVSGRLAADWTLAGGWTQLRLKGSRGDDVNRYVPRRVLRLSSTWRALPRLKLGTALRWQSDIADASGAVRQASYAVVDLNANYEFNRQWNVGLAVANVADRSYLASLKWDQAYYAAPRSVTATLSWAY
ncbi:TonB-dependent siderophore receptor [Pelomonas sp. P7]|uniref:TonB-dependent siderophore receptor n=1 Tax=Pelomonas caseinilytica TaxID=2906763 RepID=A0ABS8XIK8_9BURK|nr:TonB-dependent siderophore receptor [Pelomonas sp. P7]MCE4538666.1 TonB-dependent siderophore receptor [Pelomonas sp. P7]